MTQTEMYNATAEALAADEPKLTREQIRKAICAWCDVAAAELIAGGDVSLPHLGKLKVRVRKARKGRNLRTGEEILVPEGKRVSFHPCKEFKEAL